jgi:maltose alpha-D-glucosyltransferase / alpha-amylase
VYGYQAVNVEAGMRNPSSFLHWMQRMLEVRKQHEVFGIGTFEVVHVENPSVLAYVRTYEEDVVLCICNLSKLSQPAELPLQKWEGALPIELMGRVPFPRIGELPYFITLPPYGFYWFELVDLSGGGSP